MSKNQDRIYREAKEKVSINQISQRLGIVYGTAWSYVKALERLES